MCHTAWPHYSTNMKINVSIDANSALGIKSFDPICAKPNQFQLGFVHSVFFRSKFI